MAAFLITCEASDGAVTHYRLSAPSWHEAWQALRDRRDDTDAARIRNRSEGDVTDVEIQTGHLRIRIQSDPRVADRPTDAMSVPSAAPGPRAGVTRQLETSHAGAATSGPTPAPAGTSVLAPAPTSPWSAPFEEPLLVISTRPLEVAREAEPTPLSRPHDETLPSLPAEPFQRLTTWQGAAPRTASTVRPVTRTRWRPDTTEDQPAAGFAPGPAAAGFAPGPAASHGPPRVRPVAELLAVPSGPRARGEAGEAGSLARTVAWAVDTVAHQVPARLVLGLARGHDLLTVTQARGEGERSFLGAQAEVAAWPASLDLRGPARVRFGGEPVMTWWRDRAGVRHALEVRAAMWTACSVRSARGTESALALLVIDPPRSSGFTEGELSALEYLTRLLAQRAEAPGENGWT
jgi:hypothetical protein